jgi:hypothetical protein
MQIIKIFCYSRTRFYYCKFSTSKIKQHQPTTNHQPKKTLLHHHHQKNEAKKHHKKYII